MGVISSRFGHVLIAEESTYDTDPTPTAALQLMESPEITIGQQKVTFNQFRATHSRTGHGVIDDKVSVTFTVPVGGLEDTDGGLPAIDPLLLMCGFDVATSGTSAGSDLAAAYTLLTTGHSSGTCYFYLKDQATGDSIGLQCSGGRGNATFQFEQNQELRMQVELEFTYAEWLAASTISDPTSYGNDLQPFLCTGMTGTWNSNTVKFTSFSFATNWAVGNVNAITGSSNVDEVYLSRADSYPGGSLNPVQTKVHYDSGGLVEDHDEGTERALNVVVNDGTWNVTLNAPAAQLTERTDEKDEGIMRHSLSYECNENTVGGEDEVTITFGSV
jgi:hypothetical protein